MHFTIWQGKLWRKSVSLWYFAFLLIVLVIGFSVFYDFFNFIVEKYGLSSKKIKTHVQKAFPEKFG